MNILEAVERSTLRMVGLRLFSIVSLPFSILARFFTHLYRTLFWSDKRWLRSRVVTADIVMSAERFFKEMPEDVVGSVQGCAVRIWVDYSCMKMHQAYVLAADQAVYRLFNECDLTGFILSMPCKDGRIAYVRFDAKKGYVSQICHVAQGTPYAKEIHPEELCAGAGNEPPLEKEQPLQNQCTCKSTSCHKEGGA